MQHQTKYYSTRKSRSKSVSPTRNETTSNRRHYRSQSSRSLSNEKLPSKSTPSSSTNINKPHKELVAKLTRKVYNVNIDNGASGSKKNPKQIRRMIDDPQQIGVVRRFGEGATPIFEREELIKRDDTKTYDYRPKDISSDSSPGRRRSLSPNSGSKRFDKTELEKSRRSSSRQSRSRERRLYNKDKKKKSTSSPPAKTSYFLDTKREEDRIRRKNGGQKLDERKKPSRSRSRDRDRKHSRRRSRSRSRRSEREDSRSRLSHQSMMAVHPYPFAYYPPPYPYPAPYLPMDPAWRPYAPYPFPPRPPYPPHYLPHCPRYGLPHRSGLPPFIGNFRPRFNRW